MRRPAASYVNICATGIALLEPVLQMPARITFSSHAIIGQRRRAVRH